MALRAEILDFKSEPVTSESELETKAEKYRTQMMFYGKSLARILNLDASQIDIRLLFSSIGRVYAMDIHSMDKND